jgi:integrase
MSSIKKRGDVWRARYRDDAGKEHARHFAKRAEAQRWLDSVTAAQVRGDYINPRNGRIKFAQFAHQWLAAQTFDPSTREAVESRFNAHILPAFGKLQMRALLPSTIQAWLRLEQQQHAPRYIRAMLANLSAMLGAAVEDGIIARNPCSARSVRAPAVEQDRVVPWTAAQVAAVMDAHPEQYRAMAVLAAGCGLRQGEVFGLRVEDVDFLKRRLFVRQQVKLIRGNVTFAAPKGGKSRQVPLPDSVAFSLTERLKTHPAGADRLVFTKDKGRKPLRASHVNPYIWKPALVAAGIEPTRANGMHALRHYYASVLLDAGENIRALADYLGHADPGFTLRVYAHLMPSSEARTRRAIDSAFEGFADSPRTSSAENS